MSTTTSRAIPEAAPSLLNRRWFQLTVGVVAMMAISESAKVLALFLKPADDVVQPCGGQGNLPVLIVVRPGSLRCKDSGSSASR